jgi:hypothetical protein
MTWVLGEPAEIGRHLTALRDRDRAALASSSEAGALPALLDAHTITMAHPDGREPVEESLATWLSLLDHEAWRERVCEIRVDLAFLDAAGLELLARVREEAAPARATAAAV